MRVLIFLLLAIIVSAAYAREPNRYPVGVDLGPKAYRDGDVVQILEVTSTSPRLEQGDTVIVQGRVRLESVGHAQLGLYLTQTQGDGIEETDRDQSMQVKRGFSECELKTTIKHFGVLHLTLYEESSGRPFGGVYFGTPSQMKSIGDWDVSYYLGK